MKKILLAFTTLAILACNKDAQDDDNGNNNTDCKLISVTTKEDSYENKFSAVYTDNRITELQSLTYPNQKRTITYNNSGNISKLEDYDEDGLPENKFEFFYNTSNQIISEKDSVWDAGDLISVDSYMHEYSGGVLSAVNRSHINPPSLDVYESRETYIWLDGNLASIQLYQDGILICTENFSYDLTKEMKFDPQVSNPGLLFGGGGVYSDNYLLVFLSSKNVLTKTEVLCNPDEGRNYTHSANQNGLIEEVSASFVSGNFVGSWIFEYTCN